MTVDFLWTTIDFYTYFSDEWYKQLTITLKVEIM